MAGQHHSKAIVISPWWAGIFASVIASGMIGLTAYAFNANAQIEVMKNDVNDLKGAKLDSRLTRIESKIDILIEKRR